MTPSKHNPNEEQAPLLRAAGLEKGFSSGSRRLVVLRDLSVEIRRGELLAILGMSGIGKTTLLNLLGMMDRPDRGSIEFQGQDVLRFGEQERDRFRNAHCGFVFQAHHLLPEFNAEENVALPLWIRGVARAAALERARHLLARLDLGERAHHRPPELSGGERQRVAIARAFAGSPSLVLADEPTGNLDPETAERVFDLFRQMHGEEEVTTVLVTHNRALAQQADRTLQLEDGGLHPA